MVLRSKFFSTPGIIFLVACGFWTDNSLSLIVFVLFRLHQDPQTTLRILLRQLEGHILEGNLSQLMAYDHKCTHGTYGQFLKQV